jgi:hypothetical protein
MFRKLIATYALTGGESDKLKSEASSAEKNGGIINESKPDAAISLNESELISRALP